MRQILILLAYVALAWATPWETVTSIDEYINRPEAVYNYFEFASEYVQDPEGNVNVYFLNMTSLEWFDDSLTTTPVWWHYQTVAIPDTLTYTDTAILYISSGNNDDPPPTTGDGSVQDIISLARRTGAVTSLLDMVPNQPLYFTEEDDGTRPRSEDAIIGYTWKLFIEENVTDTEVNALFPMTKAAKQAVDTLFDFAPTKNPAAQLATVVPTGFSKRGWTSWLLGCVDQRVIAMAPVVFDLLNFYENLQHHYTSLGGWSWAFTSYWAVGVSGYLHHPRTQIIGSHIDPLEYNARLTMPKLLSGGGGDQFFLPDGTHFWWDQINGDENHYILFENDDHGLGNHRDILWENLAGFFISVKDGIEFPQYQITNSQNAVDGTGTIEVTTQTTPTAVTAWWADSTNRTCEPDDDITGTCRRDFRLQRWDSPADTLIQWTSEVLSGQDGTYTVTYDEPEFGFKIFHVEVEFPGPGGRTFHFSSESNIIPDTFPFPNCVTEEECRGELK